MGKTQFEKGKTQFENGKTQFSGYWLAWTGLDRRPKKPWCSKVYLEASLSVDDVKLDDVPLHLDRVAHLLVLLANPLHHGLVVVTHLDDVGSETALLQAAGALLTGASWARPVALKDHTEKTRSRLLSWGLQNNHLSQNRMPLPVKNGKSTFLSTLTTELDGILCAQRSFLST